MCLSIDELIKAKDNKIAVYKHKDYDKRKLGGTDGPFIIISVEPHGGKYKVNYKDTHGHKNFLYVTKDGKGHYTGKPIFCRKIKKGDYNGKCRRCGAPAFIGFNLIDCSGGCK
jgi:hypothetical protein